MQMISVKSSNIHSVGYDRSNCRLVVTFKDKEEKPTSSYAYTHVLPENVTDLLFSESIGSHFSKVIKSSGDFPCTRLDQIVAAGLEVKA